MWYIYSSYNNWDGPWDFRDDYDQAKWVIDREIENNPNVTTTDFEIREE